MTPIIRRFGGIDWLASNVGPVVGERCRCRRRCAEARHSGATFPVIDVFLCCNSQLRLHACVRYLPHLCAAFVVGHIGRLRHSLSIVAMVLLPNRFYLSPAIYFRSFAHKQLECRQSFVVFGIFRFSKNKYLKRSDDYTIVHFIFAGYYKCGLHKWRASRRKPSISFYTNLCKCKWVIDAIIIHEILIEKLWETASEAW